MLGIGDEFAVLGVHHEVEVFEGNLAQQIRHVLANVHHVELTVAPLQIQAHGFINGTLLRPVGGLGDDFVQLLQAERFDDAGLEVEAGCAGVHERLDFHRAGLGLGELALGQDDVALIGQLEFDDDFSHVRKVA